MVDALAMRLALLGTQLTRHRKSGFLRSLLAFQRFSLPASMPEQCFLRHAEDLTRSVVEPFKHSLAGIFRAGSGLIHRHDPTVHTVNGNRKATQQHSPRRRFVRESGYEALD